MSSATADSAQPMFAEPTPLGLLGLSIGCAALTPIAFGASLTPAGLETAAVFCLFFGGGGQLLAGLMNFANKNLWGGTVFTTFAFNWAMNWWALHNMAQGFVPDHGIILATEILSLVVFVVLTYGFGFYSKLLFAFLLDIDILYIAKLGKAFTGIEAFDIVIAIATVALAAIALYIAFAMLVNPTAGRAVFPVSGPLLTPTAPPEATPSLRRNILTTLYERWQQEAFRPAPTAELRETLGDSERLTAELAYLAERGHVSLEKGEDGDVRHARITADGIDEVEGR